MRGRKWTFACGFLRSPRRGAPFLIAFQAREAKIPCSFLSAFGPLPCSCTAVVRSAPTATLSDGGAHRTSHTSVHSTNTRRVLTVCLTMGGGRGQGPPVSLWDLPAGRKRREEKIQVNEHQLVREPVCEELVEECSGRKGQGMLVLGGGCGPVCFRVGSNGPV